ncbi:MAG: thiol-disulfide oxidoreductase DCC family protein [Candidatus Sericytochromatia bacterium]
MSEKIKTGILLFDGDCAFCDSSTLFIMDRNSKDDIEYLPLQSDEGQVYLKQYNLPLKDFDSVVFIENNKAYTKSNAALRVILRLDGFWKYLYGFVIVPKPIRDLAYNIFAKNRYKIFGKTDQCRVPKRKVKA